MLPYVSMLTLVDSELKVQRKNSSSQYVKKCPWLILDCFPKKMLTSVDDELKVQRKN